MWDNSQRAHAFGYDWNVTDITIKKADSASIYMQAVPSLNKYENGG